MGNPQAHGVPKRSWSYFSSCPGNSAKRVFAPDDPGIHVFLSLSKQDVDGRVKPGHDDFKDGRVKPGQDGIKSDIVW
jgi:hypothetical protein